jgi:hypothetical protein
MQFLGFVVRSFPSIIQHPRMRRGTWDDGVIILMIIIMKESMTKS